MTEKLVDTANSPEAKRTEGIKTLPVERQWSSFAWLQRKVMMKHQQKQELVKGQQQIVKHLEMTHRRLYSTRIMESLSEVSAETFTAKVSVLQCTRR
ncbi:uncharacterized protein RCO7_14947 [Rhynchosporium graminicola]|uniref:Uncharacterized protein n=1 Tax=Rhynchosporium graminicola TaxID=2792576 RepID=A0A1E1LBU6_9HELO|nr:uncharacterized protein RCO7_14947 [Rhynchosporium commune]